MATPKPVKYQFKATRYFKTVIHYSIQNLTKLSIDLLITEKINISESRDFAKSKPLFWLQERINNKWVKPRLTGLFKTEKENVFWGCRGRYEDLIIIEFKNNKDDLNLYYYKDYFTRNLEPIINELA